MRWFSVAAVIASLLVWGIVLNGGVLRTAHSAASPVRGLEHNEPRRAPILPSVEGPLPVSGVRDSDPDRHLTSSAGVALTVRPRVAMRPLPDRPFLPPGELVSLGEPATVASPLGVASQPPWRHSGDLQDRFDRIVDESEGAGIVSGAVVALVFGALGYVVVARRGPPFDH